MPRGTMGTYIDGGGSKSVIYARERLLEPIRFVRIVKCLWYVPAVFGYTRGRGKEIKKKKYIKEKKKVVVVARGTKEVNTRSIGADTKVCLSEKI